MTKTHNNRHQSDASRSKYECDDNEKSGDDYNDNKIKIFYVLYGPLSGVGLCSKRVFPHLEFLWRRPPPAGKP